ncbi:hypothetical protein F5148DRAFT_1146751 [Russula earlei]|uniref:Uncharacterized protein n=1 Tax=Russula earlei TaxID=71964 RepID=A0ACC0UKF4_9AGAM|nr:hypothetical protein F5148DRAFT_1146751 [Russula earlei]
MSDPHSQWHGQWHGQSPSYSYGQSQSQSEDHREYLTYGYISNTFGPQPAESYQMILFKVDPRVVVAFRHHSHPGAYFVYIQPSLPSPSQLMTNNGPAWLLDYAVRDGGSVVPQQIWFPQGHGDWRRYVEQAEFHIPVFFTNADGALGVPVVNAAGGHMTLLDANQPAPLGDRTTTKIRICWPGYQPSEHQVQLRDQTPARNPVTLERLVKHVGSRVRQFLSDCMQVQSADPRWAVGYGGINVNEVMLIGVVQVSAGSWMPMLQLMERVVM